MGPTAGSRAFGEVPFESRFNLPDTGPAAKASRGQRINEPEARIVARVGMLVSGVAQAGNESDGHDDAMAAGDSR